MAKYPGFGTTLKRGGTGGTAIAQIQDISGPGLSVDTADVTTHDSTAGWEEHVATVLRSGEVTFDIIYDPNAATHKYAAGGLLYDLVSRTAQTYAITFPSNPAVSWTFTAFVTGFEPSAPVTDGLTAAVTMKLTGQPTLA